MRTLSPAVLVVIGLVLGIVSLIASTYDPLWNWLGVQRIDLRASLTLALSLEFLLGPMLLAIFGRHDATDDNMSKLAHRIDVVLNKTATIRSMDAGDAYAELIRHISRSKHVCNTKIVGDASSGTHLSDAGRSFERAIEQAVVNGTIFEEVVSAAWKAECEKVASRLTARPYVYRVVDNSPLPVINFTIVKLSDDSEEVYYGWATGPNAGMGSACFHTSDHKVVSFFRELFLVLRQISHAPHAEGESAKPVVAT